MTLLYMIKQNENLDEDIAGWTYTGNEGNYLGPDNSNKFRIYQQIMTPGLHNVYNDDALYLFVPGKN